MINDSKVDIICRKMAKCMYVCTYIKGCFLDLLASTPKKFILCFPLTLHLSGQALGGKEVNKIHENSHAIAKCLTKAELNSILKSMGPGFKQPCSLIHVPKEILERSVQEQPLQLWKRAFEWLFAI